MGEGLELVTLYIIITKTGQIWQHCHPLVAIIGAKNVLVRANNIHGDITEKMVKIPSAKSKVNSLETNMKASIMKVTLLSSTEHCPLKPRGHRPCCRRAELPENQKAVKSRDL